MKRFLVALIGIVAVVAISVGIKDYVKQQGKAKPPASTSTPTVVDSNAITVPKQTTSAKTRQARMSATEANAPATAQAAADEILEKRLNKEFADTVRENPKAAHDELEAAMDRNNRVRNTARPALLPAQCLPLPNGTKLRDVDATYYKNWAREYSCLIP